MNIQIWNKKENRPANTAEINHIVNGNDMDCGDKQLFMSWHTFPRENEKGILMIHLDSGVEDEFELRAVANER